MRTAVKTLLLALCVSAPGFGTVAVGNGIDADSPPPQARDVRASVADRREHAGSHWQRVPGHWEH